MTVQNLGASINTEFGEATLFLAADWPSTGAIAYFASDRLGGLGGGDI